MYRLIFSAVVYCLEYDMYSCYTKILDMAVSVAEHILVANQEGHIFAKCGSFKGEKA